MKQATDDTLASRIGALSEPVRLRVLAILEREELSVGEVARVVQLPQSTVSRHLKTLNEAGWVSKRAAGTATLYRLESGSLEPTAAAVWEPIRASVTAGEDAAEDAERLAAVLADRPADSQAFFGRIAGAWDELRHELFGERFTAQTLLSLIPPRWVVADLGCGTGDAAARLGPVVERVIAVDRSKPMLEAARKRLGAASAVEYREGSLESLPLSDGSVDAAVCSLVLHHIDAPEAAVGEMFRVLRTERGGGVALVVDMLRHKRTEYRQTMGHKHLGFAPEQAAGWMEAAGFAQVRVREMPRDADGKGPGLFVAAGWKAHDRSPE